MNAPAMNLQSGPFGPTTNMCMLNKPPHRYSCASSFFVTTNGGTSGMVSIRFNPVNMTLRFVNQLSSMELQDVSFDMTDVPTPEQLELDEEGKFEVFDTATQS